MFEFDAGNPTKVQHWIQWGLVKYLQQFDEFFDLLCKILDKPSVHQKIRQMAALITLL